LALKVYNDKGLLQLKQINLLAGSWLVSLCMLLPLLAVAKETTVKRPIAAEQLYGTHVSFSAKRHT